MGYHNGSPEADEKVSYKRTTYVDPPPATLQAAKRLGQLVRKREEIVAHLARTEDSNVSVCFADARSTSMRGYGFPIPVSDTELAEVVRQAVKQALLGELAVVDAEIISGVRE